LRIGLAQGAHNNLADGCSVIACGVSNLAIHGGFRFCSGDPKSSSPSATFIPGQAWTLKAYALHRPHLQLTSPYPGCWAPYFPVEFRHDASRRQSAEGLSLSKARRLPQIHQRTGRAGRAGHQGGGVQPGAVRVPQSHAQPGQDSLLGCVTNAGVSQRCCIKDGSRPSGVCLQELAPNHPVLLRSKGVVVSDRWKRRR